MIKILNLIKIFQLGLIGEFFHRILKSQILRTTLNEKSYFIFEKLQFRYQTPRHVTFFIQDAKKNNHKYQKIIKIHHNAQIPLHIKHSIQANHQLENYSSEFLHQGHLTGHTTSP